MKALRQQNPAIACGDEACASSALHAVFGNSEAMACLLTNDPGRKELVCTRKSGGVERLAAWHNTALRHGPLPFTTRRRVLITRPIASQRCLKVQICAIAHGVWYATSENRRESHGWGHTTGHLKHPGFPDSRRLGCRYSASLLISPIQRLWHQQTGGHELNFFYS